MDGVACGHALDFVIAANLVPNSWMPIGITAVLTLGCRGSPPAPTPSNPVYGVERWAVKTLTDANAVRVDVSNVIPHDHHSFEWVPTRCSGLSDGRTFAEEFRVYE